MHSLDLILTLTGGLTAALVFGYLTQRAGLSPIVGYLLAGVAVGPNTPGFVADITLAEQLAELGVILLMFGVGLQFHVEELLAVRRVAVPGAVAQSVAATLLGALLARYFGWSWSSGIVFGIALSVASTVVLIRVLADNKALHTSAGHIAVGWLVVEDLFTVLALVVLPITFGASQEGNTSLATALLLTALKVAALVAFTAIVGTRVIPRALDHVAGTHSRELFTLTVLVVALGIAVGSAAVFDVSMALGAFLAGMVVGRSEFSVRAASEALPLRDAFAVLFFVSVGMLLDPAALLEHPALVAGTLAIVTIGKPLVAFLITWLMRYPLATTLSVSVALAQIGEFSFMLSRVGSELGLLTAEAGNAIVAVAIVSIVLNPLLYRLIAPFDRWVQSKPRLSSLLDRSRSHAAAVRAPHVDTAHRAVIVGYGPTGRMLTRLLRENDIQTTVVDMNVATVRELRDQQLDAVYGDATLGPTLAEAGVAGADNLILTSAGNSGWRETIRLAKEINPRVHVLARALYLRDVADLRDAGAEAVVSAEGEVALALTEILLQQLGATPDQIDRERDRVRTDLSSAVGTS